MAWVIVQDDVLYLSTAHFLGPQIWNEPGVDCWSMEGDLIVVPEGCYHATLNPDEAVRWDSHTEAKRIAHAASSADMDGEWRPEPGSGARRRAPLPGSASDDTLPVVR